jgi:hypothetical protein
MKRYLLIALLALAAGCSKDSAGPSVDFPPLPQNLLDGFCVQASGATVGQTKSGTLSAADCDAGDSFFEIWRVRVTQTTSVTFDANSGFDNYLEVARLNSYTSTSANFTMMGENDDRASGNYNALLTVTLQPDTDYFVVVSGYDYGEVGSYTLRIR